MNRPDSQDAALASRLRRCFAPSPDITRDHPGLEAGLTPKSHRAQQPMVALRGSFCLRLAWTEDPPHDAGRAPQPQTQANHRMSIRPASPDQQSRFPQNDRACACLAAMLRCAGRSTAGEAETGGNAVSQPLNFKVADLSQAEP